MSRELLASQWTFYNMYTTAEPEGRLLIEYWKVSFDHIKRRPVEVIWEKGRYNLFWLYLLFVNHLLLVYVPWLYVAQNGEWHYPNISHILFTTTQKGSVLAHRFRGFGLWSLACCFRPVVMQQWEKLILQFSSRNAPRTKIPPIRHSSSCWCCELVTKPPIYGPVGQRLFA